MNESIVWIPVWTKTATVYSLNGTTSLHLGKPKVPIIPKGVRELVMVNSEHILRSTNWIDGDWLSSE